MRSRSLRIALVLALVVALGLPVSAGPVSSGGPWTFIAGPVTCKVTGLHSAANGLAYAMTEDYNAGCAELGARLKYQRADNGVIVAGGWTYSTPYSPSTYLIWAPVQSTAVSSEHKAQNGWYPSWSGTQRPHAW